MEYFIVVFGAIFAIILLAIAWTWKILLGVIIALLLIGATPAPAAVWTCLGFFVAAVIVGGIKATMKNN